MGSILTKLAPELTINLLQPRVQYQAVNVSWIGKYLYQKCNAMWYGDLTNFYFHFIIALIRYWLISIWASVNPPYTYTGVYCCHSVINLVADTPAICIAWTFTARQGKQSFSPTRHDSKYVSHLSVRETCWDFIFACLLNNIQPDKGPRWAPCWHH